MGENEDEDEDEAEKGGRLSPRRRTFPIRVAPGHHKCPDNFRRDLVAGD
jgi:hypothetical protein